MVILPFLFFHRTAKFSQMKVPVRWEERSAKRNR